MKIKFTKIEQLVLDWLQSGNENVTFIAEQIEDEIAIREQAAFNAGWYLSSKLQDKSEDACIHLFKEWRKNK